MLAGRLITAVLRLIHPRLRPGRSLVPGTFAASMALLLAFGSAPGFAPPETTPRPDLLAGPGRALMDDQLPASDRRAAERSLEALSRATGSRWSALDWSRSSLTAALAVGSGVDLTARVIDEPGAEAAARAFIGSHPDLFRTDASRLATPRIRHALGKWSVRWQEEIGGMPVLGSYAQVLLTDRGRLAAFGASTFPMIGTAVAPALGREQASSLARAHLVAEGLIAAGALLVRSDTDGPFVLPVAASGATDGRPGWEGKTVWRVSLAVQDPPASYQLDVDATSGRVWQRINTLRTLADFDGTAHGAIENPSWCAGASDLPAPRLFVTVTGAGTDTAGADGSFHIPYGGSEPETLRAEMKGAFCDVYNVAGPQAFYSAVVTPGVPISLYWDDTTARLDERDTYYHLTSWHDRLKQIDPGWRDLDYPLPANVNLQESCNAFWDGQSINMYHEQGGCANTGRIGDVIVHEYTHGITDFMYGNDDPPGDIHEGNSDVGGNFYTNNPIVGPGFYLDDCINGIRNSDNDLRWPDDLQGEGHYDGQIIAGFHWHTRQGLINQLGYEEGDRIATNLWHFARMLGLPQSQPEQVWWNFLADDDDGNLDSGTPHYDAICQAAARHGFSCPEAFTDVVIHHARLLYGPSPNEAPIPVRAVIYSLAGPLNPDSLLVFYRRAGEGSFSPVLFEASGGQDEYQALIPGQPVGTSIDYYLLAVDALGNRLTRPGNAGEYYTFQVAYGFDDFELDGGWTVGAPGDNATTGIWERCDPIGTSLVYPLQPEDDATPDPGHICWVTGQYTGGYPFDSDANGITTLLSPVYDLTGMTWASIRYARWFQSMNGGYGYMDVWVSYDGGNFWRSVDHVGGTDPNAHWYQMEKIVTPMIGQLGLTRFKVVVYGEPVYSITEGAFDDFVLMADDQGGPVATDMPVAPGTLDLRLVSRNPAGGIATFEYRIPEAGSADLTLYSVQGSRVRTLLQGSAPAGTRQIVWDGKDERGRTAPSGVYFARLSAGNGSVQRRVVLAR